MYATAVVLSVVMVFQNPLPVIGGEEKIPVLRVFPSVRACMETFSETVAKKQGFFTRYVGIKPPSSVDQAKFCELGQVEI